jgi:hypothetical protein
MEYLIRFVVGGLVVSAFAVLSDVLRPKNICCVSRSADWSWPERLRSCLAPNMAVSF